MHHANLLVVPPYKNLYSIVTLAIPPSFKHSTGNLSRTEALPDSILFTASLTSYIDIALSFLILPTLVFASLTSSTISICLKYSADRLFTSTPSCNI